MAGTNIAARLRRPRVALRSLSLPVLVRLAVNAQFLVPRVRSPIVPVALPREPLAFQWSRCRCCGLGSLVARFGMAFASWIASALRRAIVPRVLLGLAERVGGDDTVGEARLDSTAVSVVEHLCCLLPRRSESELLVAVPFLRPTLARYVACRRLLVAAVAADVLSGIGGRNHGRTGLPRVELLLRDNAFSRPALAGLVFVF